MISDITKDREMDLLKNNLPILNKNNVEFIENEIYNKLENLERFKNLLLTNDIIAIDIKKACIIMDNLIIDYCEKHNFVIIDNFIYLDNKNIPFKSEEQLKSERYFKLIDKHNETKKLLKRLEDEINSITKSLK